MNDEQILEMGGDEEDIRKFAEEHGATNPMPPNTKKCKHPYGTIENGKYNCKECGKKNIYNSPTPSPDKSEHDGTCRTPECYEKRPTPAVEDWEEKLKNVFEDLRKESTNIDYSEKYILDIFRSLREADRKRTIEGLEKMRKDRTFTNFLRHDIADQCLGYYNQAISDAIKFITNLK